MTLQELIAAYRSGNLREDDILWLDNDHVFLYVDGPSGHEDDQVCIFRMHPGNLLDELLDYVRIPHSGV